MPPAEIAQSGKLLGEHVWMRDGWVEYELVAGTPRARDATVKFLNAWTTLEICAFISEFGFPGGGFPKRHGDRDCYPVLPLRRSVAMLHELHAMVRMGQFQAVNGLERGNHLGRYSVGFAYGIDPVDGGRGFIPKLLTPSLHAFLVHEITMLAINGNALRVCASCCEFYIADKRSDAKFCTDRCRMRNHRDPRKRAK